MSKLTEHTSFADAQRLFASAKLWELFDGDAEHLNIAHECIDRHPAARTAVIVVRADGDDGILTYGEIAAQSARFAHYLVEQGIRPGDRVAIMLEPSLAFYVGLFGAIKAGAIAVPLFTLFGPDGVRLRVEDCAPRLLLTNPAKASVADALPDLPLVIADEAFLPSLARFPDRFETRTRGDDLAIFQYTSGTSRALPAAVKHPHRALVTLMVAALYGTGLRPGDRFFCPSVPAWRHGRAQGLAARRLARDQGSRADRRGRLFLPRRPGRRRDHLGRLDDERGRDRGRDPEASGRPRRGRNRRAGRDPRPGRQGLRRRRPRRRRRLHGRDPDARAHRLE